MDYIFLMVDFLAICTLVEAVLYPSFLVIRVRIVVHPRPFYTYGLHLGLRVGDFYT